MRVHLAQSKFSILTAGRFICELSSFVLSGIFYPLLHLDAFSWRHNYSQNSRSACVIQGSMGAGKMEKILIFCGIPVVLVAATVGANILAQCAFPTLDEGKIGPMNAE